METVQRANICAVKLHEHCHTILSARTQQRMLPLLQSGDDVAHLPQIVDTWTVVHNQSGHVVVILYARAH